MTERVPQQDEYAELEGLADLFDRVGGELQERSRLGREVLADEDVEASRPLSPDTFTEAEEAVRRATTDTQGLATRAVELDADALVVRATVLTYRWIDELREQVERRFSGLAARAIDSLAPEVELGGSLVSAGLIETDPVDRDDVAAYLGELAEEHPELLEHLSTGGGLLDSLQLRSLLTVAALSREDGPAVARTGLHACGVEPLRGDATGALRDLAGTLREEDPAETTSTAVGTDGADGDGTGEDTTPAAPPDVTSLLDRLQEAAPPATVEPIGDGRFIAYVPGAVAEPPAERRLRLVGGTLPASADTTAVLAVLDEALADHPGARVMLVGAGSGAVVASEVAASTGDREYAVEQVVTVGSPGSHAARVPDTVRVLALEDRDNPVALLGSLVNAGDTHRVTVVFNGAGARGAELSAVGGRAVDRAEHPGLRAEVERLHGLGYLGE